MKTNRRRFLRNSTVFAATTALGPNLLLGQAKGANSRLAVAAIGAMGKGRSDWGACMKEGNDIVALCDIQQKIVDQAVKAHGQQAAQDGLASATAPAGYINFREMLAEMGDKIDAVTISTPDHTHFPAAMAAIALGKHVMVQKPLCNTIWEVREMHKAANKAGVVTQMGNQGRTHEGQRLAKEWVEQGAIGTMTAIDLWTNRPVWPQGPLVPQPTEEPADLPWDLWLSSLPSREYFNYEFQGQRHTVHPFKWRGWWDYGAGALGDMGCHIMDAAFSLLGQAIPEKIEVVEAGESNAHCPPARSTVAYHFAATDAYPALTVTWREGNAAHGADNKPEKPEAMAELGDDHWGRADNGMIIHGTDGVLFSSGPYCNSPYLYPLDKMRVLKERMAAGEISKTEERSTHPNQPQQEWTHAIKNGLQTSSNFDYAAPLTEFVLLGNLAVRAGKTISWDKQAMSTGDAEVDRFIKRSAYREGWEYSA
jgi:predicted dehydrogenase